MTGSIVNVASVKSRISYFEVSALIPQCYFKVTVLALEMQNVLNEYLLAIDTEPLPEKPCLLYCLKIAVKLISVELINIAFTGAAVFAGRSHLSDFTLSLLKISVCLLFI